MTDTCVIAVALSGGGVRATAFHLGVLQRVAASRQMEHIAFISTVSGGSLCAGLIYALSGIRWPTSEEYLREVLPAARRLLTERSLQRDAIVRALFAPQFLLHGRAKLVSLSIQHVWGITGLLKDVPSHPRWIINATAYESGKSWRFTSHRMGDYRLNYVREPAILLADAVAASAGYPVLIGPLVLDTSAYEWWRFIENSPTHEMERTEPKTKQLHLWDGGVYDNLGVESLYKQDGRGLREDFNFLIVSDASSDLAFAPSLWGRTRLLRPTSIAMDQVRGLRARSLVDYFVRKPGSGVYLRIGRTAEYLLRDAGVTPEQVNAIVSQCLSDEEVTLAANFDTTLRRLKPSEFDRLRRHGWEVTDCVLRARKPEQFQLVED